MTQILSFDEDSIMTSEIIAVIESRGALIEKLFDAYSTRAVSLWSRCMAKLEDMSKLCFFSTSDSHETFARVEILQLFYAMMSDSHLANGPAMEHLLTGLGLDYDDFYELRLRKLFAYYCTRADRLNVGPSATLSRAQAMQMLLDMGLLDSASVRPHVEIALASYGIYHRRLDLNGLVEVLKTIVTLFDTTKYSLDLCAALRKPVVPQILKNVVLKHARHECSPSLEVHEGHRQRADLGDKVDSGRAFPGDMCAYCHQHTRDTFKTDRIMGQSDQLIQNLSAALSRVSPRPLNEHTNKLLIALRPLVRSMPTLTGGAGDCSVRDPEQRWLPTPSLTTAIDPTPPLVNTVQPAIKAERIVNENAKSRQYQLAGRIEICGGAARAEAAGKSCWKPTREEGVSKSSRICGKQLLVKVRPDTKSQAVSPHCVRYPALPPLQGWGVKRSPRLKVVAHIDSPGGREHIRRMLFAQCQSSKRHADLSYVSKRPE
ncbi:hypothetical protein AURANDRAFT_67361 [Aureococcus anophagefferens]|uniref:Uncharacterized protein n=1 Tax=Aureococcus anophagefferens TaxID=44056 RepID=F0YKW4_AURAN|nr:hypothetical protein AURANDRAFT_67361 [Aureococcus anophagefferens]EGB04251.1 hypothetical protein AURANDRAFT_67361 [Aureococcus anophagefferens]|eukprot:XP_009041102.1 hypothetical protein AURANDRAFT_67361 [Aureococcus anophagefferens]